MATVKADEIESTTKNQHPTISRGIVQSLLKVWNNHEFEDFKVFVDGETFSCHSLILASCSEFFSGLLRANMKEKKEMTVELNNISSPTFQLILKSIYSGCDFLTKENVIDVWSAVHQLQIPFLIEHCEDFVIDNLSLDNVELYNEQADYLQSGEVKEYIIYKFMLKNFDKVRQNDIFLRLDFDSIIRLLKSDDLKVSCEDLVLYSIFDWINYGNVMTKKSNTIKASTANEDVLLNTVPGVSCTQSLGEQSGENSHLNLNLNSIAEDCQVDSNHQEESNERRQFLIHLLKASRYYLASEACIVKLYKDKLIQSDVLVKEILFEAFHFKFCDHWHNYCPTTAINRKCSNIEHVGIYCDSRIISGICFKIDKGFRTNPLPKDLDATLTIFKGNLYVCLLGIAPTEVYVLQTNTWVRVTEIAHLVQLFLSHEKYIYALDSIGKTITRFNLETSPINLETFRHEIDNLTYALSFHNKIVAFSSVVNNGVEETAVHSWNPETDLWTKHDNLKLYAQNLQCFRDDINTYLLDVYGNMLSLANSEIMRFTFVAKLWTPKYNIKGAVLFRETLFLIDGCPDEIEVQEKVEGVFNSVIVWEVRENTSNMLHYTMPKTQLPAFFFF